MQNPDGAAAAQRQQQIQGQATAIQRDTAESLALLREAVLGLTQYTVRDSPTAAPTSWLTKLGPDDDVEAYLEVFERTARRKSWPEDQWAHILSPFLTGPAQQAGQDLSSETAGQYPALKQAILAYYRHNLAARALRFHDWQFDIRGDTNADRSAWPSGEKVVGDRRGSQPTGPGSHRQHHSPASARRMEGSGPPSSQWTTSSGSWRTGRWPSS